MNIKFLVCISFFIALLCHLAFFSLFTFVFYIDPAAPKPQFFFLGPILTQKDVNQVSEKKHPFKLQEIIKDFDFTENGLQSGQRVEENQKTNPFVIRTISKPLTPKPGESQEKIDIKSTFEIESKVDAAQKTDIQLTPEPDLKIQPYRPLRFRSPKYGILK